MIIMRVFPRFRVALITGIILLIVFQSIQVIQAAPIVIPDGDVAALIAAINAANDEVTHPGRDTIRLAQGGVYVLTAVYDAIGAGTGPVGLPSINTDIVINGNGATITRAEGSPDFRFFVTFDENPSLTLNDLTLTNGRVKNGPLNFGGAIVFGGGGKGKITGSTITGNSADDGGGIVNLGTEVTIANSVISNNSNSNCCGSGIFNGTGALTITNSSISGNTGRGAGIYNAGILTVKNTTFSGNQIFPDGGGAIINTGTLDVQNCNFTENFGALAGGGISNQAGLATIKNSLFTGNFTGDGGGVGGAIYNAAEMEIMNSRFIDNRAVNGSGGGISNSGSLTVRNSNFSGNDPEHEGDTISNIGELTLIHVIIDGIRVG